MSLNRDQVLDSPVKSYPPPFRNLDLPSDCLNDFFDVLAGEDAHTPLSSRRVCRAFWDHSLKAFGSTFFEYVVVMLHPLSLKVLEQIADYAGLSVHVHHLTISGEELGGVIDMRGHGNARQMQELVEVAVGAKLLACTAPRNLSFTLALAVFGVKAGFATVNSATTRCHHSRRLVSLALSVKPHRPIPPYYLFWWMVVA